MRNLPAIFQPAKPAVHPDTESELVTGKMVFQPYQRIIEVANTLIFIQGKGEPSISDQQLPGQGAPERPSTELYLYFSGEDVFCEDLTVAYNSRDFDLNGQYDTKAFRGIIQ